MSNYRRSGFVCGESVASVQDMFVLAGGHFEALVSVRINKYLVCGRALAPATAYLYICLAR